MTSESTPLLPPLPLPAPAPSPSSLSLDPNTPFLLRRALLSDAYTIARIATTSYAYSDFADLENPFRFTFWTSWVTEFHRKNHLRLLSPNHTTYLCYPASSPSTIVAFANFSREGTDLAAVATRYAASSLVKSIKLWLWTRWYKLLDWARPSRATDHAAIARSLPGWLARQRLCETEKERWYCGSCVVLPEWQRLGLGGLMMRMGLAVAEAEGVPMFLEASPEGEGLYRKLGFVRITLFSREELYGGTFVRLPGFREGERKWWECREDGGEGMGMDGEGEEQGGASLDKDGVEAES